MTSSPCRRCPDETQRRYQFVAIDRATRWVHFRIYCSQTEASSTDFLRRLKQFAPMKIQEILTDNGSQFTDRFTRKDKRATGKHVFDVSCLDPPENALVLRCDEKTQIQALDRMTDPLHRHQEWLKFLKMIDRKTPKTKELHLVVDITTQPTST